MKVTQVNTFQKYEKDIQLDNPQARYYDFSDLESSEAAIG